MTLIRKSLVASALALGVVAAAPIAAQAKENLNSINHPVELNAYKTGSANVVRTLTSKSDFEGAHKVENGFERVDVVFDPSQLETASEGRADAQRVSKSWFPGSIHTEDGYIAR